MKNWGMSAKDKLKNIKNKTGENFNDLIRQYVQERFLARLEKSAHKESFILKGGILFLVWTGLKYRPTKDLDFMYRGMIDKDILVQKIKEVWTISIPEDGVEFIEGSLRCEEIKEEHEYGGIRLLFDCKVANIKVLMQLDICTGDKITPHIRELNFPVLISEESPILNTYPIETVLAEKIHAVIDLDITNSRLKDYYDLYILISKLSEKLNEKTVKKALITTFLHRELSLPATPVRILTEYCFEDSIKIAQWKGFLKKSKAEVAHSFEEVCKTLGCYFNPIFDDIWAELAKTAISMEFGRDFQIITVGGFENDEILLSYKRPDDNETFKYRVKFDKNKIVWAGEDINGKKEGRWRNLPEDSLITFSIVPDGIEVKQAFSDGSGNSRLVRMFD